MDSREFRYLENNPGIFETLYDSSEVRKKLQDIYTGFLLYAIYKETEADYQNKRNTILGKKTPVAEKAIADADIIFYEKHKKWDEYVTAAESYFSKYGTNDPSQLNNIAYVIYENTKDKTALRKALAWAKQSVALNETYFNLDTYACLLYATGNKSAAIKTEEKAIALAKDDSNKAMVTELETQLKKFKTGN